MTQETITLRACALCGDELPLEQFQIIERWTPDEISVRSIRDMYIERAEVDGDGTHTFYFCRWRHLGQFEGEIGPELAAPEKQENTAAP